MTKESPLPVGITKESVHKILHKHLEMAKDVISLGPANAHCSNEEWSHTYISKSQLDSAPSKKRAVCESV